MGHEGHSRNSTTAVHLFPLTGTINAPASGEKQHWYKRLLEYTLQDLIAAYMPHMVLCGVVGIATCYAYDPDLRLLLYSALPKRYQTWLIFLICYVEEIRLLLILSAVIVPILQLQVITFGQLNIHLEATLVGSALTRYGKMQRLNKHSTGQLLTIEIYL